MYIRKISLENIKVFDVFSGELADDEPPTGGEASGESTPQGQVLFIDPRHEDPMRFLELDLATGLFLVASVSAYRDSLAMYVNQKSAGADEHQLLQCRLDLNQRHHPTVWQEMKRSYPYYPQLRGYFEQAAELLPPLTVNP